MNKEPKGHYISNFYIRRFTCDLTEERNKEKLRVYTLNKNGKIEKKRTSSLCQIRGYNSTNEEYEAFELLKSQLQSPNAKHLYKFIVASEAPMEEKFAQMEEKFADSVDAIIEGRQIPVDIVNIKYFIIYLLSNQPHYRAALTRGGVESVENRIKGKGFLTQMALSQTLPLLSDWEHHIERIKPTDNKQFITSDNPVHIQYTTGSDFEGGWRLEYDNSSTIEGADTTTTITIPHDAIIFLPLNPLTGFYLYKNPNRMEDIIKTQDLVEKMNISQIRQAKEYAFSSDESWLKSMYEESLDSNKRWI